MRSLHVRLIIGVLAGISLLITIGGSLAYHQIRARLYRAFDQGLVKRAASLSELIEYEPSGLTVDWLESGKHPPGHEEGADFVQVVDARGFTLTATEGIAELELWKTASPLENPSLTNTALPGGHSGRAVSFTFLPRYDPDIDDRDDAEDPGELKIVEVVEVEDESPDEKENASLAVAEGAEELADRPPATLEMVHLVFAMRDTVRAPLASIRSLFLTLWAVGAALAAAIIFLVVRIALRPLGDLQAQIRALDDTVGGQRIQLASPQTELRPVTDELNRLLERVERAIKSERRLTSNLAHELRTPVSGLLSSLEVTLNRPRDAVRYRECAEECFGIAKQMHWLVTNLLSLSRIESGNVQMQAHIVPLLDSLTLWWAPFADAASAKDITIDWIVAREAKLETDPEFLRVVVTNLFENATCYAPRGATIRIEATGDGIWVENEAIDLDPDSIERVFEPFWRNGDGNGGGQEMGSSRLHAGLGLNLCKRIAELLGGDLTAHIKEPGSIFQVRLTLGA